MPLNVVPDPSKPLPDDFDSEEQRTFAQKVKVAAATAKVLLEAGADLDPSYEDKKAAEEVFKAFTDPDQKTKVPAQASKVLNAPASVQHLYMMLQDYDHDVVSEAKQLRRYVTNKLLEETGLPDPRHRIKALELLGKISDVGLFADKSEVTIKNVSTEDLEEQIREKLLKLMGSGEVTTYNVIDAEPKDGDE